MSPSLNSFGSNPSVSQLVWDTDLVIPDGKAIESASGEVGIIGDVSVSGSVSSGGNVSADDTVSAVNEVSTQLLTTSNITIDEHTLTVITHPVSGKAIVQGDNTLPLVSRGGATITGNVVCDSNISSNQTVILTFTTTDVTGASNENVLRLGVPGGVKNHTININVDIPAGTVKVNVKYTTSTYQITVTSLTMAISDYTTSSVF